MTPTTEQKDILDFVASSDKPLMVQAYAGAGKSATLKLIDQADDQPHIYIVFNKTNVEEALNSREFRTTTSICTINSLGHKVWAQACAKRLSLDGKKKQNIFRGIIDTAKKSERQDLWARYDQVMQGADLARALGYIPQHHAKADKSICTWHDLALAMDEFPGDEAHSIIDEVLTTSIRQAYDGIIDFPDQLYMPALFGGTFPRFPLVLIDEYQDLSPINHALVEKLCRHSRQIGVGDAFQAIYGFRGAMEDSILRARQKFQMATLPLTVSFRCPSAIVDNVHWRVPEFKASRVGGSVSVAKEIDDNSTVICRNNAPLMSAAIKLLVSGRKIDIAGVDLTSRLTHIMSRLGSEDMTQVQALGAVDSWEAEKLANESKTASDVAACMRIFVKQTSSLGQAIATVRHLAAQTGSTRFITGHKAKGMEWDKVYHLDPWLMKDIGQDPNLRYVVDTRTRDRLAYIESRDIR